MASDEELSDYEPLSNPRRSRYSDVRTEEDWFRTGRKSKSEESEAVQVNKGNKETNLFNKHQEEDLDSRQHWLKRGHGGTFIAVFLFTLILYARPSEFYPSPLTASIAFIV